MGTRLASCLVVLGVGLSMAIGPGMTLTRCLLTGDVMLSCCCAPNAADQKGVDAPDDCCSKQHLSAPWTSTQVPVHAPSVAPPMASWALALVFVPPVFDGALLLPEPEGGPPPLWLGAPRI